MENVALVLQMTKHPHPRVDALVVPAFGVDAVRAKDLQFATLDLGRQNANHAPVFILEKLSHRGREDHQWHAGMAKDQSLHVAVQFLAVSFVIFAIHREEEIPLGRCRQCFLCSRSILPDPVETRTMGTYFPLTFISGGAHRQPSGPAGSSAQSGENMSTVDTPLAAKYKGLPLGFERNEGQTDTRVKFLSRGHGYTVFLMGDEAVLELRTLGRAPSTRDAQQFTTAAPKFGIVHMKLVKASASAGITGFDQLPGRSNYFIGNDPAKWHSGVPNFAKVKYHGVYPGIDLVYYGNQGQLEYDFVVAPGANPDAIRLEFSGNDLEMGQTRLPRLDSTGALVAETSAGEVRLHKPVIYQKMNDGKTKPIDGHYRLLGDDQVAFEISPYDRSRDLVIDPVLTYASYLGGTDADARDSVSVTFDSVGNAYVASGTMSTDFPVSAGTFQGGFAGGPAICDQGNNFCGDAFVTKINPSGTAIVYSTYLGGSDSDYAFGLAVDSAGNAYVTGLTKSTNFPVTPGAFQPVFGGAPVCDEYVCGDTFVTKLNPTGSALVYSSYLGGSGNEHAEAIAVDAGGNAYVAGDTGSANFPITPGAFQTQFTGSNTCFGRSGANLPCHVAFLSKVNPSGTQLVYSTYLG